MTSLLLLSLQIDDIKQRLKLKQMEEEDHQKRISNTRRTIEDLKAELAKVGDQPDVTPRINAVNIDLRRIQEDRARIEGEKADLRREKDNLTAECRSEFPKQYSVLGLQFTSYNVHTVTLTQLLAVKGSIRDCSQN